MSNSLFQALHLFLMFFFIITITPPKFLRLIDVCLSEHLAVIMDAAAFLTLSYKTAYNLQTVNANDLLSYGVKMRVCQRQVSPSCLYVILTLQNDMLKLCVQYEGLLSSYALSVNLLGKAAIF